MRRDYKKIGLLDHMGLGNMGDAAIYESFITNISARLPNAVLLGFSLYPNDTEKRHNLTAYPIRWSYLGSTQSPQLMNSAIVTKTGIKAFVKRQRVIYAVGKPIHDFFSELSHLWRSYHVARSLDLLVIAGGGQLAELYSDLPYNVFKFCALARLARKPVFIIGVGADLLDRPTSRFFAKWAVRLSNYCSFRSVESQDLIRSLGVKKETHVCPDPAYALSPDVIAGQKETITAAEANELFRPMAYGIDLRATVNAESVHPTVRKVGLNPMGFCDPRRYPRRDGAVYEQYLDKLERFSLWLLARNYQIEIFTSDVVSDVLVIEDLMKRLKNRAPLEAHRRISVRRCLTLKQLFLQMMTFDFVITSKFHGVIFSHLLAKPVIALSYMRKIDDLMRAMGHDRYCLNIEHFDYDVLCERFESLVTGSDDLKLLFQKTCPNWASRLRTHFDSLFGSENIMQSEGFHIRASRESAPGISSEVKVDAR